MNKKRIVLYKNDGQRANPKPFLLTLEFIENSDVFYRKIASKLKLKKKKGGNFRIYNKFGEEFEGDLQKNLKEMENGAELIVEDDGKDFVAISLKKREIVKREKIGKNKESGNGNFEWSSQRMKKLSLGMTEVCDYLYIGSVRDACDEEELKKNGINQVVNLAWEWKRPKILYNKLKISYSECTFRDSLDEDLLKHAKISDAIITKIRNENSNPKILLHCVAGKSRSFSVALYHLMVSQNMSLKQAFDHIKSSRTSCYANKNFIKQLMSFEISKDSDSKDSTKLEEPTLQWKNLSQFEDLHRWLSENQAILGPKEQFSHKWVDPITHSRFAIEDEDIGPFLGEYYQGHLRGEDLRLIEYPYSVYKLYLRLEISLQNTEVSINSVLEKYGLGIATVFQQKFGNINPKVSISGGEKDGKIMYHLVFNHRVKEPEQRDFFNAIQIYFIKESTNALFIPPTKGIPMLFSNVDTKLPILQYLGDVYLGDLSSGSGNFTQTKDVFDQIRNLSIFGK